MGINYRLTNLLCTNNPPKLFIINGLHTWHGIRFIPPELSYRRYMMKRTITAAIISVALGTASLSAGASDKWQDDAKDAWIHGSAQTTLMLNTNLNAFDISSDVEDGVVTLTGEVETSTDKALAEELVEGIDGVDDVRNELVVRQDRDDYEGDAAEDDGEGVASALNDSRIFTVIKTRLLMSDEVDGSSIDVEVDDAVVTLTGVLSSDAERDLAVEIARNANGVQNVHDNLRVQN
jgi:osmotically-inducible protein OsmY